MAIGPQAVVTSPQTAINVFVLIAYNRNSTRQSDTWYVQIALRDYFAPPSPPGMHIPPFIVIYKTPQIGAHYPPRTRNTGLQSGYQLSLRPRAHPQLQPSSSCIVSD
jgi:hypothetical protein